MWSVGSFLFIVRYANVGIWHVELNILIAAASKFLEYDGPADQDILGERHGFSTLNWVRIYICGALGAVDA